VECPDPDTFGALFSGSLDGTLRTQIANHAADCDSCHQVLAALQPPAAETPGDGELDTLSESLEVRRGARIGRYVVEGRLGGGGMGVVFAAVDSELHRRVAVKVLRPDRHDDLARERLLREARTLARLSHPNVVTVFDVGTHRGNVFVAMELVDGGSLSAWLARGVRPQHDVLDRLIEAGRGLAAAHAAGVVHRDVKPDNILVGHDGRARVTDFGLASFAATGEAALEAPVVEKLGDGIDRVVMTDSPLTHTGTLIGTPAYMAPEQRALLVTNASTDQWAYCATIYEAFAGVRPFPVEDDTTRKAAIAAGKLAPPAPRRRVPRGVRRVLLRGLAADPAERWSGVDAVVRQLVRARRLPRQILLGAVALLVLVTAGAIVTTQRDAPARKPPPITITAPRTDDQRVGCNCPYSACTDRCLSVCNASGFALAGDVPGLDVDGREEALAGVSLDGETMLYLAGKRCNVDHLFLARHRGATYESIDLTAQFDRSRVAIFEGCCTLSPDARSIVATSADHKRFVRMPLVGDAIGAPDDVELAMLAPPGVADRMTVGFPVLSADERTLYYHVYDNVSDDLDDIGGNYAVTRADTGQPFTSPHRLKGSARRYDYISGVSSDGLTMFLAQDFDTSVLVRSSTSEDFGPLGANTPPRRMYGWRVMPLRDCRRVVTTSTPGGCEAEKIVFLDALTP
jgi:predicted Ser/Thr protein kinase